MTRPTTDDLDATNPYRTISPQLADEAVRLMLAVEPSRRQRRRRQMGIAAVLAGVFVAGAGVAVAAPLLRRPILSSPIRDFVVTVDGQSCATTVQVQPEDVMNRTLNSPEGMAAAAAALAAIDLENLEPEPSGFIYFSDDDDDDAAGEPFRAAQTRIFDIGWSANTTVNAALEEAGYNEQVSVVTSSDCGAAE